MLNKKIFFIFLILLFSFLEASIKKDSQLYFISDEVGTEGDNVVAYKNATALYQDKYMRADTIIYNQKNQDIEFFGNVSIVERGLYFFVGEYAKVEVNGNANIRKMFLYHKPRHIWIYADESKATKDEFILKNSFLSSCRSENPDWGFYIQDGIYSKKDEMFELYNVVLYATDIPVLYLPYLSFSTSKKRKSGLLVPEIGFSTSDGMFFAQPYYYVPNEWSDFEIIPQIRTDRGEGLYTTYRFADSPFSKGSITAGYFREHSAYFKENNLVHQQQFGLEANYKRTSIFNRVDDAFLLDIRYLNDIAYLYLKQYKSSSSETTNLIESKINYLVSKGNHSFGLYNSYVIDTSQNSNDGTLQTLPHLQYHYGLSTLFNNLLYSFNYNFKNMTRTEGSTATQHEITVPITLYWSLFDDYLRFKITENFYTSYIDFANTDKYQEDKNYYLRHYHQIEIFTDIGKRYKNGLFHSMDFGTNLIIPDIESKKGFYTPINNDNSISCSVGDVCEFQREDKIDSTLEFKFSQYLHSSEGREIFFHKILQPVIIDSGRIRSLDILDNEFKYRITESLSIYNNLNYSFKNSQFTKSSSTFEYKEKDYVFNMSHFEQQNRENASEDLEFLSTDISIKTSDKYSIFGHYSYDVLEDSTRSWGIGYEMKKRCWNYQIHYKEEYYPVSRIDGPNTDKEQMLYFLLELYPLGGFEYEVR